MNYLFITGSSKGLGKAITQEALSINDYKVIGLSRSNTLEHSSFEFHYLDLENIDSVMNYEFQKIEESDHIVLINNAGILGEIDKVGNMEDQHFKSVFNTNLIAPSILINKFIKEYKNLTCRKTIINISSGASTAPYESWAAYCASKAGLEMFTKVLEKELSPDFKVFSIAPGVVDTDMQSKIRATDKSKFVHKEKFMELKSNGALYTPKSVAEKIMETIMHPEKFDQTVFRIVI